MFKPEYRTEWIDDDLFYIIISRENDVEEVLKNVEIKQQTENKLFWTNMPNSYEVPEKDRVKPKLKT
jgi:hypothetical protein